MQYTVELGCSTKRKKTISKTLGGEWAISMFAVAKTSVFGVQEWGAMEADEVKGRYRDCQRKI